jgi:hypothetical protein
VQTANPSTDSLRRLKPNIYTKNALETLSNNPVKL